MGSAVGGGQRESLENPLTVQMKKLRSAMVKQGTCPKPEGQLLGPQEPESRPLASQATPVKLVADFQSGHYSREGVRHTENIRK